MDMGPISILDLEKKKDFPTRGAFWDSRVCNLAGNLAKYTDVIGAGLA